MTAYKLINILLKATNKTSLLSFIDFCNLFHVEGSSIHKLKHLFSQLSSNLWNRQKQKILGTKIVSPDIIYTDVGQKVESLNYNFKRSCSWWRKDKNRNTAGLNFKRQWCHRINRSAAAHFKVKTRRKCFYMNVSLKGTVCLQKCRCAFSFNLAYNAC